MTVEWLNVSKKIKKNILLENVTLTVHNGEICQLSGVNGSGKSSLLKIAIGALLPDSGLCRVDGINAGERRLLGNRIGIVPDEKGIYPKWTVRSHLSIFVRMHGKGSKKIENLLDEYSLRTKSDERASELSLGFRRRLSIALATINEPRNLLLDEPFNGLDAQSVIWLQEYLRDYVSRGRTVIFAAHNFRSESFFADRVIEIEEGKLIRGHIDKNSFNTGERRS